MGKGLARWETLIDKWANRPVCIMVGRTTSGARRLDCWGPGDGDRGGYSPVSPNPAGIAAESFGSRRRPRCAKCLISEELFSP